MTPRVRESTTAVGDPSITEDQASVEVELTNGRKLSRFVEQSLGNPAVQLGVCLAISVALARIEKTSVDRPGIYCGGKVFGVDCERGEVAIDT